MREVDLHVSRDALDEIGFDVAGGDLPDVAVRDVTLLACEGSESVAVVTYSEPVDDALTETEHVVWWERVGREGAATTYLCRAVAPAPFDEPSSRRDLDPVVQSVTPEDGGFTLTLLGSPDAFRCTVASDDAVDAPVSLRRLTDYEGPSDDLDALTPRQREVLETAYELGYYDVPRGTTAGEVADRLDLDRSTVTEHLQRAERNLVAAALSD